MNILSVQSTDIQDYSSILQFIGSLERSSETVIAVPSMGRSAEQLTKAAEKAAAQDLVVASALLEGLRTYHMQVAQQVTSEDIWKEARSQLKGLFEELTTLVNGIFLLGELSPHGRGLVLSYGERAGAIILGYGLKQAGFSAMIFASRELFLETRSLLEQEFEDACRAGKLPVVPEMLVALGRPVRGD